MSVSGATAMQDSTAKRSTYNDMFCGLWDGSFSGRPHHLPQIVIVVATTSSSWLIWGGVTISVLTRASGAQEGIRGCACTTFAFLSGSEDLNLRVHPVELLRGFLFVRHQACHQRVILPPQRMSSLFLPGQGLANAVQLVFQCLAVALHGGNAVPQRFLSLTGSGNGSSSRCSSLLQALVFTQQLFIVGRQSQAFS